MNETPAHRSIRTNFVNDNYEVICETYSGGFENLPAWRALGQLLAGRTGWRFVFDLNRADPTWNLGVFGEASSSSASTRRAGTTATTTAVGTLAMPTRSSRRSRLCRRGSKSGRRKPVGPVRSC
ncbi:hypothetical protein ACFYT4_27095 [Streptomyces sp. NPDC004609]|uniref:hypothetical protein n=1 Tax=Streptomyces sp. NPDC004609 TaxID=3364704 RepID=UPI0036C97136